MQTLIERLIVDVWRRGPITEKLIRAQAEAQFAHLSHNKHVFWLSKVDAMLVEFRAKSHRSLRNGQVLNLVASEDQTL